MNYSEERVKSGDMSRKDEKHDDRRGYMIKAFYVDTSTFLHAISKFLWAKNKKMQFLHDTYTDCINSLDNAGGTCHCNNHAWLRGMAFRETEEKMVAGWEGSYCSVISGYF